MKQKILQALKGITVFLCFLGLGYCWGAINFYFRLQEVFPVAFEGKNILVEGVVEGVPITVQSVQKFQLNVDKINHENWKGKVNLVWYQGKYNRYSTHHPMHYPRLIPGEKWRFTIRVKRARGFRNPGSFDYEAWLFDQKIQAKGYVTVEGVHQRLEKAGWHHYIDQIRQKIGEKWVPFSEQWPLMGILLAFTVGLTGSITPEQWRVFANTGTIHLISISGFHINMMAGMAYGMVNFFWRCIPFLCERWPAQRAGAVGAIVFGALYSLLAGYSIPTERSFISLSIFMGGLLFQRQIQTWRCFWWSVFIVILLDPFAPLNLSFWLTYSAVGIILYAISEPMLKKPWYSFHTWWSALKLQGQIFLGLIPFSLFWFSQVSVSSLWANLLAIPVTGFFVLPFALMAVFLENICFSWGILSMRVANWFLEKLYLYLSWISHQYPVLFVWSLSNIWMLFLGVLGILIILLPRGFPGRWLGVIFWLPLFFPLKETILYGEAYFSLLDVGQGLATVIQTQHHTLVFDTGPKFSEYFDAGQAIVLPFLHNRHIQRLDALVISHKDMDHRGGLQSILSHIKVKKVWVNDVQILKTGHLCAPNVSWIWDGVTFAFLTEGLSQFDDTNDTSCVLKVFNGIHSLLLPGDIESKAEKVLVKGYGNALSTDLLVAGHHGSKTSSSRIWLEATRPRYVLFATGYLNRYHFPNQSVVERYEKMGTFYWSTAECGMIEWKLIKDKMNYSPRCYIEENPRPYILGTNK